MSSSEVVDLSTPDYSLPRTAKTQRGKRYLESREPQVHEPSKCTLLLKGSKICQPLQQLLSSLQDLKKPEVKYLNTRRQVCLHPFEDMEEIEYLADKNDCGLFAFASSSKKRPSRLIIGRLFNRTLLDMHEFRVSNIQPISSFISNAGKGSDFLYGLGSKPLVIMQGDAFGGSREMQSVKSVLTDFFSGPKRTKFLLQGIDHVIVLTARYEDEFQNTKISSSSNSSNSSNTATTTTTTTTTTNKTTTIITTTSTSPTGVVGGEAAASSRREVPSSSSVVISFRHYKINFKKSGCRIPRVELGEIGPSFDMRMDRHRVAESGPWKLAMKRPHQTSPKKKKNISTNVLGEKRGRIHLGPQDLSGVNTFHFHGDKKGGKKNKKRKVEEY